jgi:hypothetical protein
VPYKDQETQRRYLREHYRAKGDDYRHRASVASQRNRQILRRVKEKPCADCGVQYPFYVMQLDHLRDKSFTPSNVGARSVKSLLAEIEKCEVVCANCHAERTYQRSHP